MAHRLTISLDGIHREAIKGLNRSTVFLGLGVNAADNKELTDYHLINDTNFQLLPDNVPSKVLGDWKKEFRKWIVACGFRELVDHLCLFLDRLHVTCSLIDRSNTITKNRAFEKRGLKDKISILDKKFAVQCEFDEQLSTFYAVRNCFAHRLGRVGKIDLERENPFELRFMRFNSIFTTEFGIENTIPDFFDPNASSYIIHENGTVGLKWVEKRYTYKTGDWIMLTPKDLTELLYFARICCDNFTKSVVNYAKSKGIEIKNKS